MMLVSVTNYEYYKLPQLP